MWEPIILVEYKNFALELKVLHTFLNGGGVSRKIL